MTYLNFSVLVVVRHPIAWIPQIDTETVVTTFSGTCRQHPDLIEYVNISLCQPPIYTSRLNNTVTLVESRQQIICRREPTQAPTIALAFATTLPPKMTAGASPRLLKFPSLVVLLRVWPLDTSAGPGMSG